MEQIAPEVLARLVPGPQALESLPPGVAPSLNTLRRFALEGRITHYRVGRKMLFDPEEVAALIERV